MFITRFISRHQSRMWARRLGAAAVVLALLVMGLLLRYPQFGNGILLLYGIAALIGRIPSSLTFKMAIVILACLPVLTVRSDDELLDYFAVYAFLLLVIGIVTLVIQEWVPARRARRLRRTKTVRFTK